MWEKEIVCGCCLDHQVVNPIFSWLCAFGLYPSSCEVILVLVCANPSSCEVIVVGLELCLKEEVVFVRRGVGYSL